MGFRLVPNSVTLDDLERRNIHIRSVISPNSVAYGADLKTKCIHNFLSVIYAKVPLTFRTQVTTGDIKSSYGSSILYPMNRLICLWLWRKGDTRVL